MFSYPSLLGCMTTITRLYCSQNTIFTINFKTKSIKLIISSLHQKIPMLFHRCFTTLSISNHSMSSSRSFLIKYIASGDFLVLNGIATLVFFPQRWLEKCKIYQLRCFEGF